MSDIGALPARKPFRWTFSRNCSATFAVSFSTTSTGIEISSSCLQPSSNANGVYLREKRIGTEIPEYQRFSGGVALLVREGLIKGPGYIVIHNRFGKRLASYDYR